jgi:hypothetical protein
VPRTSWPRLARSAVGRRRPECSLGYVQARTCVTLQPKDMRDTCPRRGRMSSRGTRSTDGSYERGGEDEHGVRCEHWRSALRRVASSVFRTVCLRQRAKGRRRRPSRQAGRGGRQRRRTLHGGGNGVAALIGAATAAAAVRIATGDSSEFRTMCLVRTSSRGAAVYAAELAVAAGLGSRLTRESTAAPADGGAAHGVTVGRVSAAARCVRVRVTRSGAEARGSCGAAAWRAGRPPAWLRRYDRARCCRTAPPSASRHRARVGRKRRTARSR